MPTSIPLNPLVFLIIYFFAAIGFWVCCKIAQFGLRAAKLKKKLDGVTDPVERERLMTEMVQEFLKPRS